MKRYIDANALRKRAIRYPDNHYKVNIEDIDNMLTADVQEVRHGRWGISLFAQDFFRCSECCAVWNRTFEYCPHCGTKMDGGESVES